ncbi:MAG: CpsD/CapB family tyrosine-protein kinase [Myxococcales bacterium]
MDSRTETAEERNAAQETRYLERLDAQREVGKNAVVLRAPAGLPAERYRLLEFRVGQLCVQDQLKAVGVVSALPREGRSTTAMNLALTAARAGDRRVLLLEADLRHPSLERLLGLNPSAGLADLLEGSVGLEGAVRRIARPPMWILPAGGQGGGGAGSILSPSAFRRTLDLLKAAFDCVYVDMPALLSTADAAVVSSLCDGVVLVVRPRRSQYGLLQGAAAALGNARVLGAVLNDAEGLLGRAESGDPRWLR